MSGDRSDNRSSSRCCAAGTEASVELSSACGGVRGVSTTAIHAGRTPDGAFGSLVPSLVQSTTYVQRVPARAPGSPSDAPESHDAGEAPASSPAGHCYSRVSNPTVSVLETALGALEDAPASVCFATGLAAETALFLALLRSGDHVVLGEAIYGGTVRLAQQILGPLGITSTFVDTTDPANIEAAINPRTRLVFIETPANPTLVLTDIEAVARVTRRARILLAVDNTFLTPVLQRPLDLGADITVYSTTKHIEGHSTALGGAITSRDEALLERVRFIRKSTGAIQAPLGAWLTTRGLSTLPLRMRQHSKNALAVARWLSVHPNVSAVHYPGLASFPQAELARRQHHNPRLGGAHHGGVIAFEVAGGTRAAQRVLTGVRLCALVEHVGSVETLITHPATMTHADVPPEHRRRVGISDGLIRLSVGLEEVEDILADLDRAIIAAHQTPGTPAQAQSPAQASNALTTGTENAEGSESCLVSL